jgi:hypothetical protein
MLKIVPNSHLELEMDDEALNTSNCFGEEYR